MMNHCSGLAMQKGMHGTKKLRSGSELTGLFSQALEGIETWLETSIHQCT
jgi:hypothetical protein